MDNGVDLEAEGGDDISSPPHSNFQDAPPQSHSSLSPKMKKYAPFLLAVGLFVLVVVVTLIKKNGSAANSTTSDSATKAAGSGSDSSSGGASGGGGADLTGLQSLFTTQAQQNADAMKALQNEIDAQNKQAQQWQTQEQQLLTGQLNSLSSLIGTDLNSISTALNNHNSSGGGSGATSATGGGTISGGSSGGGSSSGSGSGSGYVHPSGGVGTKATAPSVPQAHVVSGATGTIPKTTSRSYGSGAITPAAAQDRITSIQNMRNPDFQKTQAPPKPQPKPQPRPQPKAPTWKPTTYSQANHNAGLNNAKGKNHYN